MKDFEIVDLLPLHRQMTLVTFRDPNTQKCEVQILPVSLEIAELQNIQAMLKIPSEPRDNAATVSVEIDEILSRKIMDWCEVRGILPEQLVRAFVCFCGEPENADIVKILGAPGVCSEQDRHRKTSLCHQIRVGTGCRCCHGTGRERRKSNSDSEHRTNRLTVVWLGGLFETVPNTVYPGRDCGN